MINEQEHVEEIALSEIHLDRDTQVRLTINEEMVQRYHDVMEDEEARDRFPPILLFRDPYGRLWLVDGHHRVMAALRRKFASIRAIIRPGTKEDAIWEAIKANSRNGLPLQGVDIRRAVGMVHAIWPDRSNVMIAEAIGCSEITVRRFRDSISGSTHVEPERRTGKDGKRYPATRKTKSAKPKTNPATAPTSPPAAKKPAPSPSTPPPANDATAANTGRVTELPPRPDDGTPEETNSDDRRRIEANVKETQIQATITLLRNQIDEWFEIAPEDMHEGFDLRVRQQVREIVD